MDKDTPIEKRLEYATKAVVKEIRKKLPELDIVYIVLEHTPRLNKIDSVCGIYTLNDQFSLSLDIAQVHVTRDESEYIHIVNFRKDGKLLFNDGLEFHFNASSKIKYVTSTSSVGCVPKEECDLKHLIRLSDYF